MATFNGGVLGNANSTNTSNITLYTVPTSRVASAALTICNTNASAATFTVTITHGGTTTTLRSSESLAPAGQAGNWQDIRALLLTAGDVVTVSASGAGVSFTLVGHENPNNFTALDA